MSIEHLLNKRFGIRKLNEEQRIIIDSILNNEDVLALMPTGSGKSITFQLPVLFTEGRALVITPLIALMEDQVMQLKMSKINAVAIHGGLSRAELSIITHRIDSYQFIYCSPEWLQSELAEALFSRIKFTHVVLDEAHCISQWGFQFRPHYLLVNEVIDRHNAQVIALTATATKKIIHDIEEIIGRSLKVHDFLKNKDNMYLYKYEVHEDDKLKFLQKVLRESGPSIIYFSSKKVCDAIYQALSENFIVDRYHADMTYSERTEVQSRFMEDEVQVICATSAFGMGINKKNIRTVIHYHIPASILQFIQEIGRAGRDHHSCQSILLYNNHDIAQASRLLELDAIDTVDLHNYALQNIYDAEKKEKLDIFHRKFANNVIADKIKAHQYEQQQLLSKMLAYAHSINCLHHELSGMLKASSNNSDESYGRNHCHKCKVTDLQRYESITKSIQLEPVSLILERLFL